MATISSPGIGSGLDIKGIVSQLVELEKKPLEKIKAKAETTQSKITTFGQLKSLVDTLNTAVSKLSSVSGWNAMSATSSDSSIASATAIGGTQPTSFDLKVQSLATARSTASGAFAANAFMGSGTLKFTVGTGANAKTTSIAISATDKLADVASKINGSGVAVSATIMTDPISGEQRLLLRGKETGAANTFKLEVQDNDGNNTDGYGLSRLRTEPTAHITTSPTTSSLLGAGTLHIKVGDGEAVDVVIGASDNLAAIVNKINSANAGVTAVRTPASGAPAAIMLTGNTPGQTFTVTVTDADGNNTDNSGLSKLATSNATLNQAATALEQDQAAADAKATINGIAVSSSTNTFSNVVAGVALTVSKVTEANQSVTITVGKDAGAAKENIKAFVEAYNAINTQLNELTKYDQATGVAGLLQGDSTTLALQSALRTAVQAVFSSNENLVSGYSTLSSIGIAAERGGNLVIDDSKLDKALANQDAMKNLFAATGVGNAQGIAVRIKSVTSALLSTEGFFKRKDDSLKSQLKSNEDEQDRFEDKISRIEEQLNRKYSALDSQMATLNSLSTYIQQQITTWNNAKS